MGNHGRRRRRRRAPRDDHHASERILRPSGRGDNTVIEHPTRPGVVRFFTLSELRKLFGVPADFQLPAKTVAGEILGQGVIVPLFRKIIEAATGRAAGVSAQEPQFLEVSSESGQLALAY